MMFSATGNNGRDSINPLYPTYKTEFKDKFEITKKRWIR